MKPMTAIIGLITYCSNLLQYILIVIFNEGLNMAKATSPIRLQEELMQAAESTARRYHRSTAEQIEYWADLGRSVSSTIDPDVLLSVLSGLTTIKTEPVISLPIDPDEVFEALEKIEKLERCVTL
jgi:hypothetical protein